MDEDTNQAVKERAGHRCEYCHLPEPHVATPFHVEHVIAQQHRGSDALSNLANSCIRRNLHKGPNLTGIDPKSKRLTRLFNPRKGSWKKHFRFDGAILVGKTAVGRTTIDVLCMNDPARVALRQELLDQGLLPLD